jgi:uncharacterized phage protein (TIGR02218 family)
MARPTRVFASSIFTTPGRYFRKADAYNITLSDGVTVYTWTDYDQDLTWPFTPGPFTFSSLGPRITRTRLSVKNTIEVPELTVKLIALDNDLVNGIGIKQQIHDGYFDRALIQLSRLVIVYTAPPTNNTGIFEIGSIGDVPGGMFTGYIGAAKLSAYGAELTCKGGNVAFNQYSPRNLYQPACMHTFCDAGCTLNPNTYTITNTVGALPSRVKIPWGSVPGSPGNYTQGRLILTSGAASGQRRTVKFSDASGLLLQYPLYNTPAPGDTFSVLEGCDKQYNSGSGQDCTARSNTTHFKGFPFTPQAETAF